MNEPNTSTDNLRDTPYDYPEMIKPLNNQTHPYGVTALGCCNAPSQAAPAQVANNGGRVVSVNDHVALYENGAPWCLTDMPPYRPASSSAPQIPAEDDLTEAIEWWKQGDKTPEEAFSKDGLRRFVNALIAENATLRKPISSSAPQILAITRDEAKRKIYQSTEEAWGAGWLHAYLEMHECFIGEELLAADYDEDGSSIVQGMKKMRESALAAERERTLELLKQYDEELARGTFPEDGHVAAHKFVEAIRALSRTEPEAQK